MIHHIVLSGGGLCGLYEIGVLQTLFQNKYLDFTQIKSIYGTSIGAIIAVILSLNIEWDVLINYFINRPWHKLYYNDETPHKFLDMNKNKGVYELKELIIELLKHLFDFENISLDITLLELYEKTHIDVFMYTVGIDEFKLIELSHITYPNITVVDALTLTSSVPILFQPNLLYDQYCIDGGVLLNYPLQPCLERNKDENTIFGITFTQENKTNRTTSLFDYIYKIVYSALSQLRIDKMSIKNQISIPKQNTDTFSLDILYNASSRQVLIEKGNEFANEYLNIMHKLL